MGRRRERCCEHCKIGLIAYDYEKKNQRACRQYRERVYELFVAFPRAA